MKTLSKITKFIQGHPVTVLFLMTCLLGVTIYLCFLNYGLKHKLSRYQPITNSSVEVVSYTKREDGKSVKAQTTISATDSKFTIAPGYTGNLQPSSILYWDSNLGNGGNHDGNQRSDILHTRSAADSVSDRTPTKNLLVDRGEAGYDGFYFRDFTPDYTMPASWRPDQDSLVQILFDRKSLELSLFNRGVQKYITKTYHLDMERYKYNWTPSQGLTYDKKPLLEIGPYVTAKYQIFNKVPSLGAGIQFKTRKLDYNIGISSQYDDRFNKPFQVDAEVSITYRFKRWLK